MESARLLATLADEGALLAAAAQRAGTDAEIPTCPGWRMRDLLRHTGAVHRWAATLVAERHTARQPMTGGPKLDSTELISWYRDSHHRLVETLASAPPDVQVWTFHPAPVASPLTFWVRRQAHETAVHRVDAEGADGEAPVSGTSAIDADFAVDGIDELLRGFHARSTSRVRTETPSVLRVRATDADAVWTVRLSLGPPSTTAGEVADSDCELAGPADQLYLALWNRRPVPRIVGDESVAALWLASSAIG
ncbi:maleylpyruvate isomerase family mycothiol-dependent enzyme [Ruania rhizosphaerae]|uniref:maleylpyruvate isomerase family mycothiol-dependent enzyme n=1 Tax=Ruania rhizosphaerae TaxID=1840413 RepID=UPI001359092E|nr:maleylpyruvate isomerase family mycothiol-dependent enzyme [Ruania rhizosphaerae]